MNLEAEHVLIGIGALFATSEEDLEIVRGDYSHKEMCYALMVVAKMLAEELDRDDVRLFMQTLAQQIAAQAAT